MLEYIVDFFVYQFKFNDGVKALQFAEDLREHYIQESNIDEAHIRIYVNKVSPVETTAK